VSLKKPANRFKSVLDIEKQFVLKGWRVTQGEKDFFDLRVTAGKIGLYLLYVDATQAAFKDVLRIIEGVESKSRRVKISFRRPLIAIFDDNFPRISLQSLSSRGISAVTCSHLDTVTSLAVFGETIPQEAVPSQIELLKKDFEYAMFIARSYRKEGDPNMAIVWANSASTLTTNANAAHSLLFDIYRSQARLAEAEELAKLLLLWGRDDEKVVKFRLEMARYRGDCSEVVKWEDRLSTLQAKASSFGALSKK
jgi:hypothetical protein